MRRNKMTGICRRQEPVGERLYSPLGCSCQGSGEADIIHLIGSHCYMHKTKQQNLRGIFSLLWAKGSRDFPPLPQRMKEFFILKTLFQLHQLHTVFLVLFCYLYNIDHLRTDLEAQITAKEGLRNHWRVSEEINPVWDCKEPLGTQKS